MLMHRCDLGKLLDVDVSLARQSVTVPRDICLSLFVSCKQVRICRSRYAAELINIMINHIQFIVNDNVLKMFRYGSASMSNSPGVIKFNLIVGDNNS